MKRLNPNTGKPFVRGESREDGRVFYSYKKHKPLKKDGYYAERWCDLSFIVKSRQDIAKWHAKNPKRMRELRADWVEKNKDRKAQQDRECALKNPEARKIARDKWDKLNPGRTNAAKTKNRLERLLRVPAWLTEDDKWMIEQAYELAKIRTEMFGFQWHVDHIIPLKGKKVSGLHVPTNLQVIPWQENLRKGSRLLYE
jgi:hypothetical protein